MIRVFAVAVCVCALVCSSLEKRADAQPVAGAAQPAPVATKTKKKKQEPYTKWPLPTLGGSKSGYPEIILTFDDGPHTKWTPLILDELKRRKLKAIFFWVGWRLTKKSPRKPARIALVRRAIREGHIIANHTITHDHLCRMKPAKIVHEIDGNAALFEPLTGMKLAWFRAPYGDHCKKLIRILDERGMRHLHWDIDPMEWVDNDGKRVSGTLRRKTQKTKPHQRNVVLMHDTRRATTIAFPIWLDWLERENRRRVKAGEKPVRILNGSDLAREEQDEKLVAWVEGVVTAARGRVRQSLARLVP